MVGQWVEPLQPSSAMLGSMRPRHGPRVLTPRAFYRMVDTFYRSTDVYDNLRAAGVVVGIPGEALVGLRNPVNRTVEFYAKKLFPGALPGALPIETDHPDILDPIDQIHRWSNFNAVKQILAREAALYGTCFMKIGTVNNLPPAAAALGTVPQPGAAKRVFMQRIDPSVVTAFQCDERGFITVIRLDTEGIVGPDGVFVPAAMIDETLTFNAINAPLVTRTEVWDKNQMAVYIHNHGPEGGLWQLPPPILTMPLSTWGINFVPFVHAPFRDIGDRLGVCCFQHAIDKIIEIDRSATRLHQMLYRNNASTWTIENTMTDPAGRPFPALDLDWMEGTASASTQDPMAGNIPNVRIGDETLWTLPGGYTLKTLVPPIDYTAALNILIDAIRELEDDLPEMAYYRTRDMAVPSGVALRLILGPAVDTAIEARGNIEGAIIRAQQMALTIGVNLALFPALAGQSYENGDFDHAFTDRPVIALAEDEEAQVAILKQQAGVPQDVTLQEMGYERDTVAQWMADAEAKAAADAAQQLMQAQAQRAQFSLQQDQAAAGGNPDAIRARLAQAGNGTGGTPPPPGTAAAPAGRAAS